MAAASEKRYAVIVRTMVGLDVRYPSRTSC